MEHNEKGILIGLISVSSLIFLVLFSLFYNETKILKEEVKILKQKNYNDSVLVSEYQEAFHIFFDKNKISAEEFSIILDSVNCK